MDKTLPIMQKQPNYSVASDRWMYLWAVFHPDGRLLGRFRTRQTALDCLSNRGYDRYLRVRGKEKIERSVADDLLTTC